MYRKALAGAPLAVQVTITFHDPGVVEGPIVHVHETAPDESALFGPRPAAFEGPDL
jgi:hypothetical protein